MQPTDFEWPIAPPAHLWVEMTAEEILDGWRERIEKVASEESRFLAALPYVKGVAVIGSVGRGSPWPISDVDMLTVAEAWEGRDAEALTRQVESERNARLAERVIPNEIEPSEWVVSSHDLCEAAAESDDAFFRRLEHPHWLGILLKAVGGRVCHDATGSIPAFLQRCNETFPADRLLALWAGKVVSHCSGLLGRAESLIRDGSYMEASVEILRTTYQQLPAGAYAVWRVVPQSSSRGVSRFLSAAQAGGVADLCLAASRLDEPTTWERFDAVPPEGKGARDLMQRVRRGAGEDVDELAATRDLLNLTLWKAVIADPAAGPRPLWTGVTDNARKVKAQYEAARGLLEWLREQLAVRDGGPSHER
jgi:predicted nucleotidyltransferase